MDLNAAEYNKLESQGWFIGHYKHGRSAYIMIAGEVAFLGNYETYLDAEKAINSARDVAKNIAKTLQTCRALKGE